jgi:dihydroneopterin aldolase
LELHGFHGYFDEEQRLGQKLLFDVLASLAPAETHLADSFEGSVRYDQLVEEVERISNQASFARWKRSARPLHADYSIVLTESQLLL